MALVENLLNLSRDVLNIMISKLNVDDTRRLCQSSKEIRYKVCNSKYWQSEAFKKGIKIKPDEYTWAELARFEAGPKMDLKSLKFVFKSIEEVEAAIDNYLEKTKQDYDASQFRYNGIPINKLMPKLAAVPKKEFLKYLEGEINDELQLKLFKKYNWVRIYYGVFVDVFKIVWGTFWDFEDFVIEDYYYYTIDSKGNFTEIKPLESGQKGLLLYMAWKSQNPKEKVEIYLDHDSFDFIFDI